MRVFKDKVLWRIFGFKREEGSNRRMEKITEIHKLHSSPKMIRTIKSKAIRLAGHVTSIKHLWEIHIKFYSKRWKKKPFGRPRRRWEDQIKMDLEEI
jgi:hypothetical protein